jgi:hypothetical protein
MSDNDNDTTPDQRLRALAAGALSDYKAGRTSLRRLVDDLDVAWSGVSQSEWGDEFRGHWWTLEQIYAVALDRGELNSLSADSIAAIEEAAAALEALVNRWPERSNPS